MCRCERGNLIWRASKPIQKLEGRSEEKLFWTRMAFYNNFV
jgi:hypothetical protein